MILIDEMSAYWLRQNNPEGIKLSLAPKRKGLFFDESVGKPEVVLGENEGQPGKKARITINDAGVSCEKFQADEIKAATVNYSLVYASSMNISGDGVIGGLLSASSINADSISVSSSISADGGFFQTLSSVDASFGTVSCSSISAGSVIGGSISGTSGSFSSITADSVVSDSVVAGSGSFNESLDVKQFVLAEAFTAIAEAAPRAQVPQPADGSIEVRSADYSGDNPYAPYNQVLTGGNGFLASTTEFTIGFRFRTNLELYVYALCGDGTSAAQSIGLWTDDGTLVVQTTVNSGLPVQPYGGWYYQIITPVILAKDTVYRMGGWFDHAGGVTSNSGCTANPTFITYIKGCRSSSVGYGFPSVVDTLGSRTGPCNFLVQVPSLVASISKSGNLSLQHNIFAQGLSISSHFIPRAEIPAPADGAIEVVSSSYADSKLGILNVDDFNVTTAFGGTLGFRFKATFGLRVTALCAYVYDTDTTPPQQVGLWTDDGTLIAQVNVLRTDPTPVSSDKWHFHNLSTPVKLYANAYYRIGGWINPTNSARGIGYGDPSPVYQPDYISDVMYVSTSSGSSFQFPDEIGVTNDVGPVNFMFDYRKIAATLNELYLSVPVQPRITLLRTGGTTLASADDTRLAWTATPVKVGAWSVFGDTYINIPVDGVYMIGYTISFAPTAAICTKESWIEYNDVSGGGSVLSNRAYSNYCDPISSGEPVQIKTVTDWIDAHAGDQISCFLRQNSGLSLPSQQSDLCKFFCIKLF